MLRARNIYRLCEDPEAEKQCLATLFKAKRKEGDEDLAVYLLAYQQAGQGEYKSAIKTINYLKEDSKWAANRKQLVRLWTKQMNRQQKGQQP